MTGATCRPKHEIHHHRALVERHWVTTPLNPKATPARRKAALAACREAAEPGGASVEDWVRPGEVGVTWTVVVGEVHALAAERHPFWVWTPRWRHWYAKLAAAALNDRSERMNARVELGVVRS